jgi:Holliday junction resolvase RusA-like endonuclease
VTVIDIGLDIVPIAKGRPRAGLLGGRPHIYTPTATQKYEAAVRKAAAVAMAGRAPLAGPVRVAITVALPIPEYSSDKRARAAAESGASFPAKRGHGDVDNYAKAILDALNGVAFVDDCQIVDLTCAKRWGLHPGLAVTVETA